ncbi:MAG: ATP-binding protein, partial [Deltaproteobacteria bacterium]|nr:ATP-binding protein [Deltaproteobacteria bacterium]
PQLVFRVLPEGEEYVRIEIEDNGPGMNEAVCKRIFDPFYTTQDVGLGSGLGLSIAYFIVTQNHKGSLSVSSEPGQGTRFDMLLPIEHKEEQFNF